MATEFRTTSSVPTRASTLPARASLATVQGDDFSVSLVLKKISDGSLMNCTGWTWAATASDGTVTVNFDPAPQPNGVLLFMAGADTAQLPANIAVPFDVAAFQPAQSGGRVVLAGTITAMSRTTASTPPA